MAKPISLLEVARSSDGSRPVSAVPWELGGGASAALCGPDMAKPVSSGSSGCAPLRTFNSDRLWFLSTMAGSKAPPRHAEVKTRQA